LISRPLGPSGSNHGFARTWLLKNLAPWEFARFRGDSLNVRLNRSDLFSSHFADELLIYRRDLNKRSWQEGDLERIRCRFAEIARVFSANGTTRFVTALAPDKSSIYRPWLLHPEELPESRLGRLLDDFPIPDARLDLGLAQGVRNGVKDLYMPDDTHWGAAGHALAADAILDLLIREGAAHRAPDAQTALPLKETKPFSGRPGDPLE
jgi:hypothetical protein